MASSLTLNDTGAVGSASHPAWSLSHTGLAGSGSLSKRILRFIEGQGHSAQQLNAYSEQDSAGRSGSVCGYPAMEVSWSSEQGNETELLEGLPLGWGREAAPCEDSGTGWHRYPAPGGEGGGLSGSERRAMLLAALAAVTSFCLPACVPDSWAP